METLNLDPSTILQNSESGKEILHQTSRIRILLKQLNGRPHVKTAMDTVEFTLAEWQAKWERSPKPPNDIVDAIEKHFINLNVLVSYQALIMPYDIAWEVYAACIEVEKLQLTINCPEYKAVDVNCVDLIIPRILKNLSDFSLEHQKGSKNFATKIVAQFEADVEDMIFVEPVTAAHWSFIFKELNRLFKCMHPLTLVKFQLANETGLKLLEAIGSENIMAHISNVKDIVTEPIRVFLKQLPPQVEYDKQYLDIFNELMDQITQFRTFRQPLFDKLMRKFYLHRAFGKVISVDALLQSLDALVLVPLKNLEKETLISKQDRTQLVSEILSSLGKSGDPIVEQKFLSQRTADRLIQEINKVQFALEFELATRSAYGCVRANDFYLPPPWKPEIQSILSRADQAWPTNVAESDELTQARKMRDTLFTLIVKDTVPMRELEHCLGYFKTAKLHDDFKEFKEVLGEIDGVIYFPTDVGQAVTTISKVKLSPANFDEITGQLFAIETLKGFPKDRSIYNYVKLIKDFVQFLKDPNGGDQIRRSIFYMEFRKAHRMLVFKSKYHQIANIYRSPKLNHTLRKRTKLFHFLMNHNSNFEVEKETLNPSQYIDDAKSLQKDFRDNHELFRCKSTAIGRVAAIDPQEKIEAWPWSTLKSSTVELSQCNFVHDLVNRTKDYVAETADTTSGLPEALLKSLSTLNKQVEIFGSVLQHFKTTALLTTQVRFNIGISWRTALDIPVEGFKKGDTFAGAFEKLKFIFKDKY